MRKVMIGICTVVELGCIWGITGIALKRNKECLNAERELLQSKLNGFIKDLEIMTLKQEIEQLKKEHETGEV